MNSLKNVNDRIRIGDALKVLCRKTCHPGAFCPDAYCDEVWDAFEGVERFKAEPEPRWIPCSERLPDNRVSVIVCYREWQQYAKRYAYTIVVGWYARKHSVKENVFSEWEDECDYSEEDDEYYIQEGWYEFTTQGNSDLFSWYINAEVIAWMPLPEPYKEEE